MTAEPASTVCSGDVEPDLKRNRVRLLVTIMLLGTVASVAFHYMMGAYFGKGYPRSTFLFDPVDHFNDWDNCYIFAQEFLQNGPGPYGYFPFAVATFIASTLLPMRVGFALLVAAFLSVLALLLRGWVVDLQRHALTRLQYGFVLIALSYPVLFALDRTNPELLVFCLLAGFLYFVYVRDLPWLAALFLAAAMAFKLFPATLLLLLAAERRFKTLALSVLLALALTAGSTVAVSLVSNCSAAEIWSMCGAGKEIYIDKMIVHGEGLHRGHSLWGLLRVPGLLHGETVLRAKMTLYAAAAALLFLLVSLHVIFRETERWKRVLLSVVPAVLLPFVSSDYTLISMYFPLVFFLNSPRASRWDTVYVVLFAILLVPTDYRYLTYDPLGVSSSCVIYPLALLALAVLAMTDQERQGGAGLKTPDAAGGASRLSS